MSSWQILVATLTWWLIIKPEMYNDNSAVANKVILEPLAENKTGDMSFQKIADEFLISLPNRDLL